MAMTDAEDIIMTCQSQEECLKDLEALMVSNPEDFDDKYANEVVQDFITMVIDKGFDGAKEHVENYPHSVQEKCDRDAKISLQSKTSHDKELHT